MRSPKHPRRYFFSLVFAIFEAFALFFLPAAGNAQVGNGAEGPVSMDSSQRADSLIKGGARVNPRTLALEFSLPLMSYPGRNGHGANATLDYSSKVWRMDPGNTWWYYGLNSRRYVTDLNARFAERTAAGWTSGLAAPLLETRPQIYNQDGRPSADLVGDLSVVDSIWADAAANGSSNLMPSENFRCVSYTYYWCPDCVLPDGSVGAHIFYCNAWEIGPGIPEPPDLPPPPVELQQLYYIARVFVSMPGGARHEFRRDDAKHSCGPSDQPCQTDLNGTFLSTDATGMRLERSPDGSVLYLPNGSRYFFPPDFGGWGDGITASRYVDVNGNTISYSLTGGGPEEVRKVTDTLGRELTDFVPRNQITQLQTAGEKSASLPWFGGGDKSFGMTWSLLKPSGCEASADPDCADTEGNRGGALRDQSETLFYDSRYFCRGSISDDLVQPPSGEVLFPATGHGVRPCTSFRPGASGTLVPVRFNPVVLEKVTLPDGRSYAFKYNRYGEITRIVYPTGVYEEFDLDAIDSVGGVGEPVYDQTNRGVIERRVYSSDGTLQQRWKYSAEYDQNSPDGAAYTVVSTVSRSDDPQTDGARTETVIRAQAGEDAFGFRDPEVGSIREVRRFDEAGALVARTVFRWTVEQPLPAGEQNATRDLRSTGSIAFVLEPGEPKALASMSSTEFDDAVLSEPGYFPHLNVKRKTVWGYAALDAASVATMTYSEAESAIAGQAKKVSLTERDYLYREHYRARGVTSLVASERLLDPSNAGEILNQTEFEYDSPEIPLNDPGDPPGWSDPGTQIRGNRNLVKKFDPFTGEWLIERFEYDKFGNTVRSWDASGDEERYTEVSYSQIGAFAYPASVSLPAPDPGGTHGSSERSVMSKTYDMVTGLLLSSTDLQSQASAEDDRTTIFEYSDPLLRVTVVREPGGTVKEYFYSDSPGESRIRTREMFEPGRAAESEVIYDGYGREVMSRTFGSEGTTVVDSKYDLHGRLVARTAPYFEGSPASAVTRFRTSYDPSGRVVGRFTDLPDGTTETSAGISYGISALEGVEGRYLVSADGSGRRKRVIRDSEGRVVRTDEAVSATGHEGSDLGPVSNPHLPTTYKYGNRGGLVEIRQGVQRRIFARDAFGRIIFQKLPEQEVNPDLVFVDPATGNTAWSAAFEYDFAGNVVRAVDANGVVAESQFDRADRVVNRTWSDGTPSVSFKYDLVPNGRGEVIEVSNDLSTTRIKEFDSAGRPTVFEQSTGGTVFRSRIAYDLTGDISEIKYPSGKVVEQAKGRDGRLRRVSGTSGLTEAVYANSFVYGPRGKTGSMRLGNGRFESAEFYKSGRLASIGLGASAQDSALWSLSYEYGEIGPQGDLDPTRVNGSVARLTMMGTAGGAFVQTFGYDPIGRISSAEERQGGVTNWTQGFGYDRYGNRTALSQELAGIQAIDGASFDELTNRFTASEGFVYDRNGNVVREPSGRSFVFDGKNKQTEVRSPDGILVARYSYDGNGRRVKTETPLETTVFVYADDRLIAEYSTNPSRDTKTRYITQDHLGSTRVVTDGAGAVLSRRDHLPFGEELVSGIGTRSGEYGYSATTSSLRPGFAGLLTDPESGLGYAEARVYDNRYGRFTTVDPLLDSADPSDPRTFNRYAYTLNDPVNLVDSEGLAVIDDWYVNDDGKIEVYRTEDPFDRFYVFDKNKKVFVMVAQLDKNKHGLVRFPDTGWGFTYYNPGERGGYDPDTNEHVGQGDHYLLPVTAAALFGFTNQLKNDYGITLALGDMSSSNGSDPWDSRFRTETWDGHHSSHGHKGNGSGESVDFRYVDNNGRSRQGNWVTNPGLFSPSKNQAVFDLAKKWGFGKSFRGYNAPIAGTNAAKGHNDHGHLGFDLSRKPKRIFQDRRKYYIRWSDVTLDCLVESCN